jgi:hypothetical protein
MTVSRRFQSNFPDGEINMAIGARERQMPVSSRDEVSIVRRVTSGGYKASMMVAGSSGKAIGNAVYYLPFSYVAIVALSLSKKTPFCNLLSGRGNQF